MGGPKAAQNPQQQQQQQQPQSFNFPGLTSGAFYTAADKPLPTGRVLMPQDLTPALQGRQAELYWPDDGKWYLCAIQALDMSTRQAT